MAFFIIVCLVILLLVGWVKVRDRLSRLEYEMRELGARFDAQTRFVAELNEKLKAQVRPETAAPPAPEPVAPVPIIAAPIVRRPEPQPEPVAIEIKPTVAPYAPPPVDLPQPAAARSTEDWEALLGGNWLNKIGVFVLVVGIALALGYSFTQFGPLGRVTISVAASLVMLVSGALLESKERYKMFARGLLGGGWAALYVTVYAMHAVASARVIESPAAGAVLLLAVAAGMIVHSLRYRSPTVTGLAYFVAFGTLALTDTTSLPYVALVPLAASLLYVAHRFNWTRMTLLGLIGTYAVVILRGDNGSPLWQAQAIFAVYWLLFEAYDVLHPEAWLLPLNAAGALGLSILKWQNAAPDKLWMLLAVAAGAYLLSAALRIRRGKWEGAATLTAALAAGAIFQKLDHQWIASALAVEAELFYLAGVRLHTRYLRWLGSALFAAEIVRLLGIDMWLLPSAQWIPVASVDIAIFYANRALYAADSFYGYAAAGLLALVIGKESQEPGRSVAWQCAAAAAFAFGWWRKLFDFRLQGYLLLALGLIGTALDPRVLPLAVAAGICYAAVMSVIVSGTDRFGADERDLVRWAGGGASVAALMALGWRIIPAEYLGVGWMALAVLILELGMRRLPGNFKRIAYAVMAVGIVRLCGINLAGLQNSDAWPPRLMPLWASLLAYALAIRARREEGGLILLGASSVGLMLGAAALWALLPVETVAAAWAAAAILLLLAARQWNTEVFAWQSYPTAALAYLFCLAHLSDASALWTSCAAIACFYAAQLMSKRGSRPGTYFSLLATTLTTLVLYYRISGSMLTMACGVQGVILLASGFPLRDRVLRLSGLALLLGCILKLFGWDLRHLETLPRIFSFIVLGMILLAVSFIYTRYRERVAKFL